MLKKISFILIFLLFFGCVNEEPEVLNNKTTELEFELWEVNEYQTYTEEHQILAEEINVEFEGYSIHTVGSCASFQDNSKRDQCFLECGIQLNSPEVCSFTSNPDECLLNISIESKTAKACDLMDLSDMRNECYFYIGYYVGNLEACDVYDGPKKEYCYLSAYEFNNIKTCNNLKFLKNWCEYEKSINLNYYNQSRDLFLSNVTDCFIWAYLNTTNATIAIQNKYSPLVEYYFLGAKKYSGDLTDSGVRAFIRDERVNYVILDSVPTWAVNPELETGLETVYVSDKCSVIAPKDGRSSPGNFLVR
ncbi:hypothetical protein KO465_05370 [Candidatus Micrarchaeota archaeon]|nr:hypothetical protein [Candidatus Micrarchaeota archaeon]